MNFPSEKFCCATRCRLGSDSFMPTNDETTECCVHNIHQAVPSIHGSYIKILNHSIFIITSWLVFAEKKGKDWCEVVVFKGQSEM